MKKLKGKENGFENFESLINIQFLHVHKLTNIGNIKAVEKPIHQMTIALQ